MKKGTKLTLKNLNHWKQLNGHSAVFEKIDNSIGIPRFQVKVVSDDSWNGVTIVVTDENIHVPYFSAPKGWEKFFEASALK